MSIKRCSYKCNSTSDELCSYSCGGTILDDETILSAAHCFVSVIIVDNTTVFIEAGIKIDGCPTAWCPSGQDISVQEIIIHPNWHPPTMRNNIAILKLATPLQFNSNVQPACLPDIQFTPDKGLVSGWGYTKATYPSSHSTMLKFLRVNVVSNEKCNKAWVDNVIAQNFECRDLNGTIIDCLNAKFVYPSMICAGAEIEGNCMLLKKIIAIFNPGLEAIYV